MHDIIKQSACITIFLFFCVHYFHLGILDAEELTHLVHVLLFQQAPLKIVLPDVLVSSHRIVAAMLLTGASCGIVMTSIPWVAGIFDWLHFHPHARLLHAACQGKLFLSHILLHSRVLVSCLQDATMAIALHNRNALSTCVPVRDAIGCHGPPLGPDFSEKPKNIVHYANSFECCARTRGRARVPTMTWSPTRNSRARMCTMVWSPAQS